MRAPQLLFQITYGLPELLLQVRDSRFVDSDRLGVGGGSAAGDVPDAGPVRVSVPRDRVIGERQQELNHVPQ